MSKRPKRQAPVRRRGGESVADEKARARVLRAIAARLAELDVRREYQAGADLVCSACGERISHVDALVYRGPLTYTATHATYPCARWWLVVVR